MVIWCSALNCSSKQVKGSGLSFHRFPMNPELKMEWVKATKRENFNPTKYSFLCGKHFKKQDYVQIFGQIKLRDGAVPTIFNHTITRSPIKELDIRLDKKKTADDKPVPAASPSPPPPQESPDPSEENTDTTKRKRSQKIYLGDFNEEDMECPAQAKIMFHIAKENAVSKNKTIKYLRDRVRKLEKKVESLETTIESLKKDAPNLDRHDERVDNALVKVEHVKVEESLHADFKPESFLDEDVVDEFVLQKVKHERIDDDDDDVNEKFMP